MDSRSHTFGAYRVRTAIGAESPASVYRGYDPAGERAVIIRTFESPELAAAPARAELLAALRRLCDDTIEEPGIARPLDCGSADDIPFLVLEYLPGRTMDLLLHQDGPRPAAEVLQRVGDLAEILDRAAASTLHHGALSPQGIVCDLDTTRITGCGVAQALAKAGIAVSVAEPYASPQRLAGARPTRADDIYSLAAVTLALLIGTSHASAPEGRRRVPRPAAHETRWFTRIAGVDAGRLRAALAAALADDASRRPPTAREFLALLHDALAVRRTVDAAVSASSAVVDRKDHPLSFVDVAREARIAVPAPDTGVASDYAAVPAPRAKARMITVVAALATGLGVGFGGGFVLGQQIGATVPGPPAPRREQSPIPSPVHLPLAAPDSPAPTERTPADPNPADVQEQPPAIVESSVAAVTSEVPSSPSPVNERAPSRLETAGPDSGALQIMSRPTGAQVFVDDHLVGTTPLLVSNLPTGAHRVRLQSEGQPSWDTVVRIAAGRRFRLSASLDR